ncbi:hypothetical protein HYDPIDRAFT_109323 [Hydnomerulius pinastri MD-312]|nr:hypothetical protein HYDPIDRAFT_109323 [Hydnomerulius pinastri MD-312]
MSYNHSLLPSHSQTRYAQHPEADFAPRRRVRTSEISPAAATHARQKERWIEESDIMNIARQHHFSPEDAMRWYDSGMDNSWAVANREQERACREDVDRALYYQQRARERQERDRRASVGRHHHQAHGSISSMPPISPVAWPASPNGPMQFHMPSRTRVHSITSRNRPVEAQPLYVFPSGYPQPTRHIPGSQRRPSVDRARTIVPPPIVLVPTTRSSKPSVLARLNPFNRLRTTSMSAVRLQTQVLDPAPLKDRPARLRRKSARRD